MHYGHCYCAHIMNLTSWKRDESVLLYGYSEHTSEFTSIYMHSQLYCNCIHVTLNVTRNQDSCSTQPCFINWWAAWVSSARELLKLLAISTMKNLFQHLYTYTIVLNPQWHVCWQQQTQLWGTLYGTHTHAHTHTHTHSHTHTHNIIHIRQFDEMCTVSYI